MKMSLHRLACAASILLASASASSAQQAPEAVPAGPFKTVHLMNAGPAQTAALTAAVIDLNREFKRHGCAVCAYHMYRVYPMATGQFNVMLTADWPNRSEYLRIHDSAEFLAVYARNPVFGALEATQFYGRFVEDR